MSDFKIHVLGCGSALPTTRHLPSAQVVELRNKLYMVDCGEGAQLQMRKMSIRFSRIAHIFITHLHGDHCFGLPGLISTLGMLGRTGDLIIHGPKEITTYLQPLLDQFAANLPYKVCFHEINPYEHTLVMEDKSVQVYSIPLKHRIPCCGYLFCERQKDAHIIREMTDFYKVPISQMKKIKQGADFITPEGVVVSNDRLTHPAEPARKYAYCSDTSFAPEIVPFIKGIDLLYHEATFSEEDIARSRETNHSTAGQAGEIARLAEVKELMIGHYSARYTNVNVLLEEAKKVFPRTRLANEGLVIDL